MWLCTRYGFFSAVCARTGGGSSQNGIDVNRIMVRARLKVHLERLVKEFGSVIGDVTITESPHNDYRWRFFIDKAAWAEVVKVLVLDTDYDNFKFSQSAAWPGDDYGYHSFLSRTWGNSLDMQSKAHPRNWKQADPFEDRSEPLELFDLYEKHGLKAPGKKRGSKRRGKGGELPDVTPFDDLTDADREALHDQIIREDRVNKSARKTWKSPTIVTKSTRREPPISGAREHVPGASGRKPTTGEGVLLLKDADNRDRGIIWWASDFREKPDNAYAEAIREGVLPDLLAYRLVPAKWQDVRDLNVPIYDWRSVPING